MDLQEPNFIDFECPCCCGGVSYMDLYRGTAQACPNCGEPIVVPGRQGDACRRVPMAIQTSRLLLRRLQRDDDSDLLEYWADESLFPFDARPSLDEDQIVPWLERISQIKLTQTAEWFPLGIVEQATNKLIGDAGVHIHDSSHLQAQVAVCLNPKFHRQGFGAETLAALQVFCFREIGMHRITATCDSRNFAAIALLNKAGLRREGEFIQDREVNGEWVNTVWFAMLREEYQRRTQGGI